MVTPDRQSQYQKKSELEHWENVSRSRFVLKKFNSRGDIVDQMIGGRVSFHVTFDERVMNMEMAATSTSDPFSNGMFAPLRLIDGTEDLAEIASNPNLMAESDMIELVKGKIDGLRTRLGEIRNPVLVGRLLEVAVEQDATVGKVDAIKTRIADLSPATFTEISTPS